ncbi:MAG: hypothetical protein WC969_07830 [Elusimicrobiota bacterium]|jgi:hypothetical protein
MRRIESPEGRAFREKLSRRLITVGIAVLTVASALLVAARVLEEFSRR